MTTQEVPVQGRFPQENIRGYGPTKVYSMTATVEITAPNPPSENHTIRVIKVEISCTNYLDTHTILIDDASILRMFMIKDGTIQIDLSPLDMAIPVYGLEAAGPMPDNDREEDTDEDIEMVRKAWETCRLVWGHYDRLTELGKQMSRKREPELAGQASSG